ncbi:MAG: helix-turn-helix domain-containing protein [Streptosporangiales bacterium]
MPTPHPTGPTVPRWRLGELLDDLQKQADVSNEATAKELGCSTHKLRKIFGGQVGVAKQELRAMLALYGVDDQALHERLDELATLSRQRAWWSKYTRYIAPPYATFIGFEYAATSMRNWQPVIMPGLLQTEAYARALCEANRLAPDDVEHYVDVRMARQQHVWGDGAPDALFVLDESVLHRTIGGPHVLREQLERLLDPPGGTLRFVPLNHRAHPGAAGSLSIFEFPGELYRPVAWLEGHMGLMRMEQDEVDGYRLAFDHVLAAALSVADSQQMIRGVLDELSRPSGGNTWIRGEST